MEFEDLLDELTIEAQYYTEMLNKVSQKIKKTEDALKELDVNIPFCVEVKDGEFVIHWAKLDNNQNFRLFLTVNDTVSGSEVRPFSEHKKEIRMEASSYIEEFLRKFIENIRKKKV